MEMEVALVLLHWLVVDEVAVALHQYLQTAVAVESPLVSALCSQQCS